MTEAQRAAREEAFRIMAKKTDDAWETYKECVGPYELVRSDAIKAARQEYEEKIARIEGVCPCVPRDPQGGQDSTPSEVPVVERAEDEASAPAESMGERATRIVAQIFEPQVEEFDYSPGHIFPVCCNHEWRILETHAFKYIWYCVNCRIVEETVKDQEHAD